MNSSRLFTVGEEYKHLVLLMRTVRYVGKARRQELLDKHFMERIMLGVTQVNGCPLCSYAHTKMALEMGMEESQIEELLGGELANIPPEQLKAVLFGQHYAEMKGKPSKEAWGEIVHVYGEETAKGILGTIRIMMVGNIWGVVIGLLKDRIQHRKIDERSSLGYELLLTFAMLPFIPIAAIHALISALIGTPLLKFSEEEAEA
ncbi:MAG TPA: carboxymuconolactone decarboxylase family protein [Sphaerochaeta sp.]|nr:carboxymuconolactone decarboxylase family protein [Sphaerochaeta sp.]